MTKQYSAAIKLYLFIQITLLKNKARHRIVDRAPPFVFYGGGSYKSIFSYLIDAYSEDMEGIQVEGTQEGGLSRINPFKNLEP